MSRPPRVVHVAPRLFGYENIFGGGERFPLELARAMARRVPTKLICFGKRPARLRLDNLDVHVLPNWIHRGRFEFDPINPLLIRHLAPADVIHVHQTHTFLASLSLVFARLARKRIFATHLGSGGVGLHLLRDTSTWFTGHLHLSEFSRRYFGHEHLATARVVYAAVDTAQFTPTPTESAGAVVYIGRILPHKGINYLIEAVDEDVPLTIVGRRWNHAERFGALLDELAQNKRVQFLEGEKFAPEVWAPEGDNAIIARACRGALCVVLPSVHTTVFGEHYAIPELLGIALLEGMASGLPAIATDVCSLPEVVEDGVTGFIVPPNDAKALRDRIRWLRDNPDRARAMGEAARQRVLDQFSWDRVVDRCFDAYGVSA
jgi:glycosyltransferase involved in cell wall biosynthesis